MKIAYLLLGIRDLLLKIIRLPLTLFKFNNLHSLILIVTIIFHLRHKILHTLLFNPLVWVFKSVDKNFDLFIKG